MGHSEVSKFVRRLFHLFLSSGPSVLSDAAHPEMEIFFPKKKSNTGGLKRGIVPYTFGRSASSLISKNNCEGQGWSVYYYSFRTEPKLRSVSCGGGL